MIAAQGLTKFYGETCAIRDLDFEIDDGEIVGILGLNGAGKSTTLRILACLLLPSGGSVLIKDRNIVEHPHETRKLVGFLPETPPLYDEMTVSSYLIFAGELRGMRKSHAEKRLGEVVEQTELTDVRDAPINSLSHGFRQRVGIAQALIHDPPVLILDEPISGLDPAQIKEMRRLVRSLGGQHTVLVSSHILSEISQTCDRILVIHDGELVASGTEEDLATKSDSHRHQMTVRGDAKKVQSTLQKLEGVVACAALGQAEGAPFRGTPAGLVNHYQIETKGDRRENLARAVVEAGFGLLQLTPAAPELESAFLELTRRGGKAVKAHDVGESVSADDADDAAADDAAADDAGEEPVAAEAKAEEPEVKAKAKEPEPEAKAKEPEAKAKEPEAKPKAGDGDDADKKEEGK